MRISQFSAGTSSLSMTLLAAVLLVTNILAWYSYATAVVRQAIEKNILTTTEISLSYTTSFLGAILSLLAGAALASKIRNRRLLLSLWIVMGAFFSVFPAITQITAFHSILAAAFLSSVTFGIGLPTCLALFAENTSPDRRGRMSAAVLLITFLATIGLRLALTENTIMNSAVLLLWRLMSLMAIPFVKPRLVDASHSNSFVSILTSRSFYLYLVPWGVFSLVNYFAWSISMSVLGNELSQVATMVESILVGIFAVVAGFASDIFGRKRVLMIGFVSFGLGYALLGVAPSSVLSWYFYTVVDGIALGAFYVVFMFTIWGDLADERPCEKYYAIGILPYSLSSFLHLTVGSAVAEAISPYAIFSFAAFFLFLAVVPLMYAPETLPEKTLKDRDLKIYVRKAMQKREKYA